MYGINLNCWSEYVEYFQLLILFNILSNCLLNNKCKKFSLCCSFRCVKVLWNQEFMTTHRHLELEAQQTFEVSGVAQIYTFWGCALWDQCQSRLMYSGSSLVNLESQRTSEWVLFHLKIDWTFLYLCWVLPLVWLVGGMHYVFLGLIQFHFQPSFFSFWEIRWLYGNSLLLSKSPSLFPVSHFFKVLSVTQQHRKVSMSDSVCLISLC